MQISLLMGWRWSGVLQSAYLGYYAFEPHVGRPPWQGIVSSMTKSHYNLCWLVKY